MRYIALMRALGRQVFSLAVGQFFIEYYDQRPDSDPLSYAVRFTPLFFYSNAKDSVLPTHSTCHIALSSSSPPPIMRKARPRTKPAGLFIHPNDSNLARADAVAVELGVHGSTERVSVGAVRMSDDHERTWERGHGRDAARALLGGPQQVHSGMRAHAMSDSQQRLFQIGDSASESDD